MTSNIHEVLHEIQQKLKAPKGQTNSFGKYKYRNCGDILEAVKPHLPSGFIFTLSDDLVMQGDRYYIKATAMLANNDANLSCTAFAREALTKKGMDESQITGTASSYARKYAADGLLAIDNTKDADSDQVTKMTRSTVKETKTVDKNFLIQKLDECKSTDELGKFKDKYLDDLKKHKDIQETFKALLIKLKGD